VIFARVRAAKMEKITFTMLKLKMDVIYATSAISMKYVRHSRVLKANPVWMKKVKAALIDRS
jgi:hypothetical protein